MQGFELSAVQSSQQEEHTRKLLISAGTWFGLIFGFGFAVLTWGYDALVLSSSAAVLAWTKFLYGLSITVIVGGLVGRLAARASSVIIYVIAWAATGWFFGLVAGHLPFDGNNLTIWFLEPRLWGEITFLYDSSAEFRTTLVGLFCILIGAFTGLIESFAVNWSWDRAKPNGQMSSGSFVVLLVSLPMALLMAFTVDYLVNQPIRKHEQAVGNLIKQARTGQLDVSSSDYRTISPFLERLSDAFSVHFVAFGGDERSWYSAYVDVVFEDGFLLRCATSGKNVIYCDDFSAKYEDWMDELVQVGLSGERLWLEERVRRLTVDDPVVAWLEAHGSQMSEVYEIDMEAPQNGWIFISAKFDSGFEMTCRFHGAAPIVVDQCTEFDLASPE